MERGSRLQRPGVLIDDPTLALAARDGLALHVRRLLALDGGDPVALQLAELVNQCTAFAGLRVVASGVALASSLQLETAGWWTRERTAQALGVSPQRVSKLVHTGGLRGSKCDGRLFVDPESVEARRRSA